MRRVTSPPQTTSHRVHWLPTAGPPSLRRTTAMSPTCWKATSRCRISVSFRQATQPPAPQEAFMLAQFSKNISLRQSLQNLSSDQRGFVLPTAAVFFIISLPVVGLVIDVGLDYLIQTKLQMAIDAAALAGARSLSRGTDDATQQTNAENTAKAYLTANFPSGYLGVSTPNVTNVSVSESQTNVRSVSITATATM